jgi:hypothetical protein
MNRARASEDSTQDERMADQREWNAHQRAGQVTFWLVQGRRMSTAEIARLTGLSWDGAKFMMEMLSGLLPIVYSDDKWHWLENSK